MAERLFNEHRIDLDKGKIGRDHDIIVEAYDDPAVQGVTCYVSRARTGGIKGTLGLAEDRAEASIACRQVGPISFPQPLKKQEEVFSERMSIMFKRLRIVRMVDAPRNTLVYLTYSEKLVDGSPQNSVTAVPVDRATPILNSKVHQVKFNPYWTVPKSIIQKDLIKYMNEDPEYLTKFRIRIFDGNGNELQPTDIDWSTDEAVKYTFRQDPGAENSMGHCKIDFYNPYDVYMHDTPQKALFGENARFHSSGCMRCENIDSLAAWLLRDNGGWDLPTVQAAFEGGLREDVPLKVQVPIHTTYITAWANRQGSVSFRDDVYNYDAQGTVTFTDT